MNAVRISAKKLVEDIKAGMNDASIMEKYGLSARSLPKVKDELMRRGLLTPEDVSNTNGCPISERITIKAGEFVETFRKAPDDLFIMSMYTLTPEQLERIYRQLITKGLLTEYEFHNRDRKSPELQGMELPEPEETTRVDLADDFSGRVKEYDDIGAFRSSVEWLKESPPADDKQSHGAARGKTMPPPVIGSEQRPCPRCGKPKIPESPDSCPHCGVVFAKLKADPRMRGVAIWDL